MDMYDIDAPPVHTKINENGRVGVPAELRDLMGVKPGDAVVLTVSGGVLRVESYRSVIEKIRDSLRPLGKPGVLMSDELIAERREEARREMAEIEKPRSLAMDGEAAKNG
jgi:AbrB family looped-hinge helix DNA binding protein